MRKVLFAAVAALVCACGQSPSAAAPSEGSAGGAATAGAVEDQAAFVARCTRETIASNPESRNWAAGACGEMWPKVVAAGPIAELILAAAPATATAVDVTTLAAQLTAVRWRGGTPPAISQATMGDVVATIGRATPQLSFNWNGNGDLVPYALDEALKARGARLAQVACVSYGGPFDVARAYRVEAPGKAPFGLTIYAHDAAVAGAYAAFNAGADLSGQPYTLASLRAAQRDAGWEATCPQ